MNVIELLQKELEKEALTTRKMLERIPTEQFEFRPHEKSMTIRELATHIAEIPGWVEMVLTTDGLDFAVMPYKPTMIHNTPDLLAFFEKKLIDGRTALAKGKDEQLNEIWTMRNGDDIYDESTKYESIRDTFDQIIHHRAQLGVFLRLLEVPIPGSYGPSADENNWAFA
jgi:uncharacterized damage-inducible protein DinB